VATIGPHPREVDDLTNNPPPQPPYQPPTTPPPVPPPGQPPPQGPGGAPQTPGVGAWLSEAWKLVSSNLGACIGMMLLPAIPVAICAVIIFMSGLPAVFSDGGRDVAAALATGSILGGVAISFAILVIVMPALQVGILACFWEMIQTGKLTFARITDGLPVFLSTLGLGICFGLIGILVSIIANAVPILGQLVAFLVGFPLAAWVSLAIYHLAVERRGAIAAIGEALNMLMADILMLSLMGVVAWVLGLVGTLACGIGILITAPVSNAAWGLVYRDMRSQA